MKETRKREFPLHFAKGKKLFQITVHMSDRPGSLSTILDDLGERVNLIGISSYTLGDGTAMFTAFVEALSRGETSESIKKGIDRLEASLESEVTEGHDGLLVDTFHTGLEVGDDQYLMMRREGLSNVFDQIVKIFGTGGEVLLYEEGKALGEDNSERRVRELGADTVVKEGSYISRALAAQGWGVVSTLEGGSQSEVSLSVTDCFECSGGGDVRKGCDFIRGFFEGSVEVTGGAKVRVEEVACRLRGEKACVFKIHF